jgi:hypothetical protein
LLLAAIGGGVGGAGRAVAELGPGTGSAGAVVVGGVRTGGLEQATKLPTIAQPNHRHRRSCMTLILLEALGAGLLLALIVWWTMFSGRDGGELQRDDLPDTAPHPDDAPPGDASTRPPAQVRPTDSNTS